MLSVSGVWMAASFAVRLQPGRDGVITNYQFPTHEMYTGGNSRYSRRKHVSYSGASHVKDSATASLPETLPIARLCA